MTSVAPGDWRYAENPDGSLRVDLTFPGVADVAALCTQVEAWLDAMERCVARDAALGERAALLVPSRGANTAEHGPLLHYLAPLKIGAAILPPNPAPADVLRVLRRIATALDALHARGFIHGALGMSSLWWMEDGTLRFVDAGLTHILDGVIRPPKVAGAYLAPEVWRRSGIVPASDQYGLAVIAFEMFTGRGRYIEDEANGVQSVQPLTLEAGARLYEGAPAELNEVMQQALSTSPSSRYGSCLEFVEALEGHSTAAKSLPTVHRFAAFKGGFRKQTAVLALATIVVLGGSAYVMRAGVKQRAIGGLDFDLDGVAYAAREKASALPNIEMRAGAPKSASRDVGGGSGTATSSSPAATRGSGSSRTTSASDGATSSQPAAAGSRSATPAVTALQQRAATLARDVKRAVTGNGVAAPPAYSTRTAAGSRSSGSEPASTTGGSSGGGAAPSGGSSAGGSGSASTSGARPASSGTNTGSSGTTRTASGTATASATRNTTAAPDSAAKRASSPAKAPTGTSLSEWVGKIVGGGPQTPSAPLASGTLQLKGPSRARYYIDGVLVRPVRGMVTATEGEHDVDIVIPNGSIFRRRVMVIGGQTAVVK